jgi:hypothetical protein
MQGTGRGRRPGRPPASQSGHRPAKQTPARSHPRDQPAMTKTDTTPLCRGLAGRPELFRLDFRSEFLVRTNSENYAQSEQSDPHGCSGKARTQLCSTTPRLRATRDRSRVGAFPLAALAVMSKSRDLRGTEPGGGVDEHEEAGAPMPRAQTSDSLRIHNQRSMLLRPIMANTALRSRVFGPPPEDWNR